MGRHIYAPAQVWWSGGQLARTRFPLYHIGSGTMWTWGWLAHAFTHVKSHLLRPPPPLKTFGLLRKVAGLHVFFPPHLDSKVLQGVRIKSTCVWNHMFVKMTEKPLLDSRRFRGWGAHSFLSPFLDKSSIYWPLSFNFSSWWTEFSRENVSSKGLPSPSTFIYLFKAQKCSSQVVSFIEDCPFAMMFRDPVSSQHWRYILVCFDRMLLWNPDQPWTRNSLVLASVLGFYMWATISDFSLSS